MITKIRLVQRNLMPFWEVVRFLQRRRMIGFLQVALFLVVISGMLSCQKKVSSDLPPDIVEKKIVPQIDAINFETTYKDSGTIRYHLVTPHLLVFNEQKNPHKDPYYEFPQGFHVQNYGADQKIESEMSANYGKYFNTLEKWYASGNVVLVNSKGDTLRTEEMNYDRKQDLIYSDKFVSIKKGDQYITGSGGFKSDVQMTKWTFMKTQGHVYLEDQ